MDSLYLTSTRDYIVGTNSSYAIANEELVNKITFLRSYSCCGKILFVEGANFPLLFLEMVLHARFAKQIDVSDDNSFFLF